MSAVRTQQDFCAHDILSVILPTGREFSHFTLSSATWLASVSFLPSDPAAKAEANFPKAFDNVRLTVMCAPEEGRTKMFVVFSLARWKKTKASITNYWWDLGS